MTDSHAQRAYGAKSQFFFTPSTKSRLSSPFQKENDERNQQEEMMLKLLEETCAKIEESLTNWFLKLDGIDCTLSFFKIIIIICESVLMRLA